MNKISPIKERILHFIEFKRITKESFCKNTGISYANLRGKSLYSEIGGSQIAEILSIYGEISPLWLLTGEGDMLKISSDVLPKQHPTHPPAPPDQSSGSVCKLCQEKDERIRDLKSSIQDLKDNINNLKEINMGLNGIMQSQQSMIQSLQDHIDDLQQPHFDADESTPSRTG